MPNAVAHQLAAAVAVGSGLAMDEAAHGEKSPRPVVGTLVAVAAGTLPDVLEPAVNPHHRRFFHSVALLAVIGAGVYQAYKWEPRSNRDQWVRTALLAVGGAYLVHLVMAGCTPRSLPLV